MIGIVDFSLQEYGLSPEFYARYRLMNVKNHEIYNSNFNLNVLSLNHIDLATKDDCSQELNHWAAMFKAKTWEELEQANSELVSKILELEKQIQELKENK